MALFEAEGLVAVLLFFFWAWAVIDVIATDESLCRNLGKGTWLIVVLVLPDLGALAWTLLGRPEGAGIAPGGTSSSGRTSRPGFKGSGPYRNDAAPRYLDEHAVSDRRSKELDELLDAQLSGEKGQPTGASELDRRTAELDAREAKLRERELEVRGEELQRREDNLG